MPLIAGARLGPYEIVSALGAGGMGEVYRARDTKLHRDVAIKVLPDSVANDRERLARFQREAEALAALNHPNIATIHGVEESQAGMRALVMELVEGPTLAELITSGAGLPLTQALQIARQIADALEAAHDKHIVHRDLKPANIKLKARGDFTSARATGARLERSFSAADVADCTVKVLDFGLAKALADDPAKATPDNSPTFTAASIEGVILGTAAYMSPEQASGRIVDERADIWAFGVVLFEMLSGRPLFRGETTAHILAEVLKSDPAWDALPNDTPTEVQDLLERCLRKNPRSRLRDIGDARVLIEDWLAKPETSRFAARAPQRGRPRLGLALVAGAFAIAAVAAGLVLWRQPPAVATPSRTWEFPMGEYAPDWDFIDGPVISPDGTMIAFGGGRGPLRVRALDALGARELAGTEGATMPFWSPDSAFIGYQVVRGFQHVVWKVAVGGGTPIKIADGLPGGVWGASWGPDRAIVLNIVKGPESGELFSVPDRGGTPARLELAEGDKDMTLWFPLALQTGDLLYSRTRSGVSGTFELVLRRQTGAVQVVQEVRMGQTPNLMVVSAQSGYLLHSPVPGQGVWATRFDSGRARFVGEPLLISQKGALPTASADGTLVYKTMIGGSRQLAWVDRAGELLGSIGQPQEEIFNPALAPDGARVAVAAMENDAGSLWIHDVVRGTKDRVDSGSPTVDQPTWSPGGDRLAAGLNWDIAILDVDATKPPETVAGGGVVQMEPSWSRDGRYIVFTVYEGKSDIWFRTLGDGSGPQKFLATPANEGQARLAPDGRHVAYSSDESGRSEVYVREFPSGQRKQLVSVNGGASPKWSPKGDELFFVAGDTLMAAAVEPGPTLQMGVPKALFAAAKIGATAIDYDVAADGRRFVVVKTLKPPERHAVVVENWQSRLEEARK